MRKSLLTIGALCVSAACLGACNSSCGADKNNSNEYDELNAMLKVAYSQVVLTVSEDFGDNVRLTSVYTMDYSQSGVTVNYEIERITGFGTVPSESFKTTYEGEVVIKDGVVTPNDANIDATMSGVGVNFKEEYFEDAIITSSGLIADVKNINGFMGSEVGGKDMKVNATIVDSVFDEIIIKYTSESGNKVEINYSFTR